MSGLKSAFDDAAKGYDDLYKGFYEGVKRILAERLFLSSSLGKVLDAGGGGQSPEEIFSPELLPRINLFVSNDLSLAMIQRNKFNHRVNGDAFTLPFQKKTFDSVLLFGCLHHLGQVSYRTRHERLHRLLDEAERVLAEGGTLYIQEPTLPPALERLQHLLLFPLYNRFLRRPVPIYMYRSKELASALSSRFVCEILDFHSAGEIMGGRAEWIAPFLFLPWFKIPVRWIPYRYLFCRARSKD